MNTNFFSGFASNTQNVTSGITGLDLIGA